MPKVLMEQTLSCFCCLLSTRLQCPGMIINISREVWSSSALPCTSPGWRLLSQHLPFRGGSAAGPLIHWHSWCSLFYACRRSHTSAQSAARLSARSGAWMSTRGRTQEKSLFSVTWVGILFSPLVFCSTRRTVHACACVCFVSPSVPSAAFNSGMHIQYNYILFIIVY